MVKRNQDEPVKKNLETVDANVWCFVSSLILTGLFFLGVNKLQADYIYEANQNLFDLTNQTGTTNLNVGDDQLSAAFNLDNSFSFYGNAYDSARMATNGCLHFGLGTGNVNYNNYCGDYTPDPLPQYTNTLFPFWTDLIRDNQSKMLAKNFSDKAVFGWYDMKEYNRNSDNSFEVVLWNNDTFEFRYGALDIIQHDVLIGEQGSSSQYYQYLFHDECNTGTTNVAGTCVNSDWNNTASNTLLENGGSLYGVGVGQSLCITSPLTSVNCAGYAAAYLVQQCALNSLYDEDCDGYAAAYLTQQCNVSQLYSQECPNYWDAYDDLQCSLDPQYGPFCAGYSQQESVAYFDETYIDYGYEESMTQYDTFDDDPYYGIEMTDEEWYQIDLEEFGQEQVDEWYGVEVEFQEDGMVVWDSTPLESYDDIDTVMDTWDIEQEQYIPEEILLEEFIFQETFLVEDFREPETFIELETIEELEEWFEEETRLEEEIAQTEEPEEELVHEEIFEEEAVEEVFETMEEQMAEAEIEEERIEEEIEEEEVFEEEFEIAEREDAKGESSISRNIALRVVASTITTAQKSVSGITAGSSIHSNNNSSVSSNVAGTNSTGASSSINAGISTSSSPSMSDQFASSTAQTNQVLDMSSIAIADTSISTNTVEIETASTEVVVANVSTTSNQATMTSSISSVNSDSNTGTDADTETTVETIIAKNLQAVQEEVQAQQEETGEYGSENAILAMMSFVPGFNNYKTVYIPKKELWYESKSLYTNNTIGDNTTAFYNLTGTSIRTLTELRNLQPNL